MSNTPRTDANIDSIPLNGAITLQYVSVLFARQLERELNSALDRLKASEAADEHIMAPALKRANAKIAELEVRLSGLSKLELDAGFYRFRSELKKDYKSATGKDWDPYDPA